MYLKTNAPLNDPEFGSSAIVGILTSSTTYVDLVNITGKGILIGISQGAAEQLYTKIVVDGVTLLDALTGGTSTNKNGEFHLLALLRFETSLQIQVKTNTGSTSASASYVLD